MLLYKLPLNLTTTIIHTNRQDLVNTVVGFYNEHKNKLVVHPEYKAYINRITDFCEENIESFDQLDVNIELNDGFNITAYSKTKSS